MDKNKIYILLNLYFIFMLKNNIYPLLFTIQQLSISKNNYLKKVK